MAYIIDGRYVRDGVTIWYKNNKIHREDGPAIIRPNGGLEWYKNNKIHREDGPAVINNDCYQAWYKNGKRHRTDGPAYILNNTYKWYINGILHREDGPAVIHANGTIKFYHEGKLHRENSKYGIPQPAVIINKNWQRNYFVYYNTRTYSEKIEKYYYKGKFLKEISLKTTIRNKK